VDAFGKPGAHTAEVAVQNFNSDILTLIVFEQTAFNEHGL